jgi:hypothetical protein
MTRERVQSPVVGLVVVLLVLDSSLVDLYGFIN